MKKILSKNAKATLALALATVLAVPAVSFLAKPVKAAADVGADGEIELPKPIKTYDFETDDGLTFSAVATDNPAKLVEDETRGGKVLALDNGVVVTGHSVDVTTKYAVDYKPASDDAIVATEAGNAVSGDIYSIKKIIVTDYTNSSVEIENPFAGRTDLVTEPVAYLESYAPVWDTGVTVSYWMKTAGTGKEETSESPILSFNRAKEGMAHKDDRDKQKLANLFNTLDRDGYMFKQLFAPGEIVTYKKDAYPTEYKGLPIDWGAGFWWLNEQVEVLENYGIFAVMNPDFPVTKNELYYFRLNSEGTQYSLQKITAARINLSEYLEPEKSGSKVRYGTEQGCMTFLASGGYVFTETGLVSNMFMGGSTYDPPKESERQFQRNTLRAYTYIQSGNDKTFQGVVDEDAIQHEALIENTEWHYITYVITNGYVSLYVDGVSQDTDMFTNTTVNSTLIAGQSFNKGYGYHCDNESVAYFPDIVSESGGPGMLQQADGYLLGGMSTKDDEQNIIKNEEGVPQIGYNGNCNADTLMEYLTDNVTKLYIGEDGPDEATTLMQSLFGSKAGTAIDNLSFYDVPLTGEEVMKLYKTEIGEENPDPINPSGDPVTPTDEPIKPTDEPIKPTDEPIKPTDDPVAPTGLAGDADCNEKVDLEDAKLVLRVAVGIPLKTPLSEQGKKNADYDKNGSVNLEDAKYTLKKAVGIPFTVKK